MLCLTVFALLSLSSVQAERRLADAATQSVVDYYQADLRAEEIFARLRDGEQIAGIEEYDGKYQFEVPISGRQTLAVALSRKGDTWTVLRWQAVTLEEALNESLNVWKGSED